MATIDVTVEEIEGAPLLINPKVKEVKPTTRSRLNLVLCIVLVIDTLFQLVAIVTPGWNVQRAELGSSHESVYYTIACADTTPLENVSTTVCNTWTFLDDFSKEYNTAKDSKKPTLAGVYNLRVRYQINVQISWLIVAGTTVFQIIRYIRANETYPRLTAINAMLLLCACSAMYQALYESLVKLDVTSRLAEYLGVEIGFPYSVLLYSVAFMQTCACTVIVVKQVYDYIRHIQLALLETKVQVDTLQMQYEAEAEEFKHYRLLQTEKSRLRGRSRKSHHIGRNSKTDKNRHGHSTRLKYIADRSPVYSEGDNSAKCLELLDISSVHSSVTQANDDRESIDNVNHSRDLYHGNSDLSDISRDSSSHHPSSHGPHNKSVRPQKLSTRKDQDQGEAGHMRYSHCLPRQENNGNATEAKSFTGSVKKHTDTISNKLLEEQENNKGITKQGKSAVEDNSKGASDSKPLQKDYTSRIVSADVHIPSIDGEEIKD